MKENKEEPPGEYINDMQEWMNHQYDPGYWTGGNIPPHIKYIKRPPRLFRIILGIIIIAAAIFQAWINIKENPLHCLYDLVLLSIGIAIILGNLKKGDK